MDKKRAVMQRLINTLDNAAAAYGEAAGEVTDPRLQELLGRTARMRASIADQLAGQIVDEGGTIARRGSRLGSVRTLLAETVARIRFDTDMAYANHAVHREVAILRHLRNVAARITDTELRDQLQTHCLDVERSSTEMCYLRVSLLLHTDRRAARALANMQVPARWVAPPPTVVRDDRQSRV